MVFARSGAPLAAAAWFLLLAVGPLGAQTPRELPGRVVDRDTGRGIGDVTFRVEGTDVSAVSGSDGRFVLRGLATGQWTLRVQHLGYGIHTHPLAVVAGEDAELLVRLAPQAIELEALLVEVEGAEQREARADGSTTLVVDRAEIERNMAAARHLGDFLRHNVPGIRIRQPNRFEDSDVCVEFRASGTSSLVRAAGGCNHPMVILDGVPIGNPQALYGSLGLQNIERLQVIPPGAAGARYGTGSLFGVLLIDTRPPGSEGVRRRPAGAPIDLQRRSAFDWSTDPAGHPFARSTAGAFLGNALGLAAGVAIGGRCIGVNDEHEIETSCGFAGNTAAGAVALALPALAASWGARWGGETENSRGRRLPALLAAGLMLFPGYTFSMSTVGGGSTAANVAGNIMLVVGTPLFATLADRMFRDLR